MGRNRRGGEKTAKFRIEESDECRRKRSSRQTRKAAVKYKTGARSPTPLKSKKKGNSGLEEQSRVGFCFQPVPAGMAMVSLSAKLVTHYSIF